MEVIRMFVFECSGCKHINHKYETQPGEVYVCKKCFHKVKTEDCRNLLDPCIIERVLINLGKSGCAEPEKDNRFSFLKYYHPGQRDVSNGEYFDTEELVNYIKGLTLCEGNIKGWQFGSASVVFWAFYKLAARDEDTARKLAPWICSHTQNDYTHMYVRLGLQNAYWRNHPDEHKEYLERKKTEKERNRKYREIWRAKEKEEIQKVHQERVRKKTIIRKEFLDKLKVLSIKDQLKQLAYDEIYPPQAYPDSLAEQASLEVLKILDQELLVSLRKKCNRKLKRQWGLFKKRVIEINQVIEKSNKQKFWVKLFGWFSRLNIHNLVSGDG